MSNEHLFTATIRLGNEAMSEPEHVAGALRQIAEQIEQGDEIASVRDENGNTVGTFSVYYPELEEAAE